MQIFKFFDENTMCLYVIRANTDRAERKVTLDVKVHTPIGHVISMTNITDRDAIGRTVWERYEAHTLRRGSEHDFDADKVCANIWDEMCKERIAYAVNCSVNEPENRIAGYDRTPTYQEILAMHNRFEIAEEDTYRDWCQLRNRMVQSDDWYYV